MATRSTISIRNSDGSVTTIYCHWDGYLSYNGKILLNHYTTEEKIRQLMELGDISSLNEEIGEQHLFEFGYDKDETKTWCKSYKRDRGDLNSDARIYPSFEEMLSSMGQEYNYIFEPEDNCWYVNFYDTIGEENLKELLIEELLIYS